MSSKICQILFFVLLLFPGCKQVRKQERFELKPVSVEVVETQACVSDNRRVYVGEIETGTQINLTFPLGGKLKQLAVKNGDVVKKGCLIARIDDQQQQAALRNAKAQLAQAKDACERVKKVWEQGAVAEVKWIEMQTKLEQAQSLYDMAQKNLDDCTLTAPVNGQIDGLQMSVGQQLAPEQRLCSIVALQNVSIRFSVPENEVRTIKKGQPCTAVVSAIGEDEFEGEISEIGLTANRLSHSYEVTMLLHKRHASLLPGMVCKVLVDAAPSSGMVIPAACVQIHPEGPVVWVVGEDDIVTRRPVKVSEYVKNGVLVSEGLNMGEKVVVKGYQKLYDGAQVEIKNSKD